MPTSWGFLASSPFSCSYELTVACSRLLLPSGTRPIVVSPSEVDLVPTLEEYAGLLQLDSPFSETLVIPIQGPQSNRGLEKYLGLASAVLRPEIIRPEETWRKANISLDLLTRYFSRSDFPVELARDFIAGKRGWKKFRVNAFKIAFAGIFLFPASAGKIDLGVIPLVFSEGRSIILAILCETVRPLSYCRRQGEGSRCSALSFFNFGSAVTYNISTTSRPLTTLRGIQ